MAILWFFVAVKGATLAILFGVFVSYSAFQMFMDKKPKPTRQMPGSAGQLGMGGFIGMLSGLVGAGGAFVAVPLMAWCNVAIHNAIGTSAALGFPIALANITGFVISGLNLENLPPGAIGYIWLPGMLVIACFSVVTAPFGARAAHRLPVKKLKRVFSFLLIFLAAYMFNKGMNAT